MLFYLLVLKFSASIYKPDNTDVCEVISLPALWPQTRLRRFLWGWHFESYQLAVPLRPRLQWCGQPQTVLESGQMPLMREPLHQLWHTHAHTHSCSSPHTLFQVPNQRSSGLFYGPSLLHWADLHPVERTGWTRCLRVLWSVAWSGRFLWEVTTPKLNLTCKIWCEKVFAPFMISYFSVRLSHFSFRSSN